MTGGAGWARLVSGSGNIATNISGQAPGDPAPYHGSIYLKAVATPDGGAGNIYDLQAVNADNLSLTQDNQYLLTFYYQNTANHPFKAGLEESNGLTPNNYFLNIGSASSPAVTTWTKANYLFTAGSDLVARNGSIRLKFQFGSSNGTTLIDSVNLINYTATLPVTLTSYSASITSSSVKLNWETASELNSNRFEVLKSTNGVDFSVLASVPSANKASKYVTEDKNPSAGANYYKLIQYDNDGAATDYGVKSVNFALQQQASLIYPNPSKGQFNLQLSSTDQNKVSLRIISSEGKVVQTESIDAKAGISSHQITLKGNVTPGLYTVQLSGAKVNQALTLVVQ